VAKVITGYWRDIPSHVSIKKGRETVAKKELSPRFAEAIDRAAMRGGLGGADDYMSGLRNDTQEIEVENPEAFVTAEVAKLEEKFPDDYLDKMVKAGGVHPAE
jgi:Virulence factor